MNEVDAIKEKFIRLYNDRIKSKIEETAIKGEKSVVLDFFDDIDKMDGDLGEIILNSPKVAFIAGSEALKELSLASEIYPKYLRIKTIPEVFKKKLSKIKPSEDVNKIIEFEGIVKRITEVYPRIKKAVFRCKKCGYEKSIEMFSVYHLPEEKIALPYRCDACDRNSAFDLIEEKCERVDYQKIEVQEFFEEMDLSGAKHRMVVHAFDDLTNIVSAGDRVRVIGILYDKPVWKRGTNTSTTRMIESVALWIETLEKSFEEIEITQEDIKKIKTVSKDPDIYEKFVDCIAPSIYGLRPVKKGILLQLFGGIPKIAQDKTRRRGDIHVLLIGDPATAKSQLTYYATKLSPKGVCIGSKTVTATGLIASVVRDNEFGEGRWILDAGAMALADMGMIGLDELDKMDKKDRDALHTAMEQQEVTISKAGITATLKLRCSVIANANPRFGRFDTNMEDVEQIDLPPTLLSRFDLIFVLKDIPNKRRDGLLAEHILNIHSKRGVETPFDIEFIRKYIAYAKKYVFPIITDEASRKIKEYYVETRNKNVNSLPLTPRYLETLIRLSEASARVRLSDVVEKEDVERAIEVIEFSLWSSAFNEETQTIDVSILDSGLPSTKREKIALVLEIINEEYKEKKKGIWKIDLIDRCRQYNIDEEEVEKLIKMLKERGKIFEPKPNLFVPLID